MTFARTLILMATIGFLAVHTARPPKFTQPPIITKEYRSLSNVDIVVVMDTSNSIDYDEMEEARKFLKELMRRLIKIAKDEEIWAETPVTKPLRIGIVRFDFYSEIVLGMTVATKEWEIDEAIDSLASRDENTCIKEGIVAAIGLLEPGKEDGRKTSIILISDGESNCRQRQQVCKMFGDIVVECHWVWYWDIWWNKVEPVVFSIGVGIQSEKHEQKLEQFSQLFLEVESFQKLPELIDTLAKNITLTFKNCLKVWVEIQPCKPIDDGTCEEEWKSSVTQKHDPKLTEVKCTADEIWNDPCPCPSTTAMLTTTTTTASTTLSPTTSTTTKTETTTTTTTTITTSTTTTTAPPTSKTTKTVTTMTTTKITTSTTTTTAAPPTLKTIKTVTTTTTKTTTSTKTTTAPPTSKTTKIITTTTTTKITTSKTAARPTSETTKRLTTTTTTKITTATPISETIKTITTTTKTTLPITTTKISIMTSTSPTKTKTAKKTIPSVSQTKRTRTTIEENTTKETISLTPEYSQPGDTNFTMETKNHGSNSSGVTLMVKTTARGEYTDSQPGDSNSTMETMNDGTNTSGVTLIVKTTASGEYTDSNTNYVSTTSDDGFHSRSSGARETTTDKNGGAGHGKGNKDGSNSSRSGVGDTGLPIWGIILLVIVILILLLLCIPFFLILIMRQRRRRKIILAQQLGKQKATGVNSAQEKNVAVQPSFVSYTMGVARPLTKEPKFVDVKKTKDRSIQPGSSLFRPLGSGNDANEPKFANVKMTKDRSIQPGASLLRAQLGSGNDANAFKFPNAKNTKDRSIQPGSSLFTAQLGSGNDANESKFAKVKKTKDRSSQPGSSLFKNVETPTGASETRATQTKLSKAARNRATQPGTSLMKSP